MIYKRLLTYFTKIGMKHFSGYFSPLKHVISKSNLSIVFDLYVGKLIFFSIVGFVLAFTGITLLGVITGLEVIYTLALALIISVIVTAAIFTVFHSYPFQILRTNRRSIEANMSFAINHMAAISSSGVSPYVMFQLLGIIKEYGEISKECKRIIRNIDIFGMDLGSSIKNVASRTPSDEFKKFLLNINSIISTGGDLKKFLENYAKDTMFEYRLKREGYLQTLSTYADIYTAVLIAAPLFFVSVLSIMALVGGQILGLNIPTALRIGIYGLVPIMNIGFLLFIHYTQPSV